LYNSTFFEGVLDDWYTHPQFCQCIYLAASRKKGKKKRHKKSVSECRGETFVGCLKPLSKENVERREKKCSSCMRKRKVPYS
jgi:hypothetical protein